MKHAFLTVDLGFGDAGKGTIVDFLVRDSGAHTVVRFNGGAQAAHRVVEPGPAQREHVFAQFGSGTLAGAATHLSRFMLLDPLAMQAEEAHLRMLGIDDAFARTTIDTRALVITPFQRAANRLAEIARGDGRHGSCGVGIGETMVDFLAYGNATLFAGDLLHPDQLRAKLRLLQTINRAKIAEFDINEEQRAQAAAELSVLNDPSEIDALVEEYGLFCREAQIVDGAYLQRVLAQPGAVVFEAAQGVLLDEWRGFHPHTTWSTTTLENADALLNEAQYSGTTTRIGITRAYSTRHGTGPLVSEDAILTEALPDACNLFSQWQHGFRVGWLDLVLLRYAAEVVGTLDTLAVTCLDRLADLPAIRLCHAYQTPECMLERLPLSATPHDLAHQEQLTELLNCSTALLEDVADLDTLLARVSAELATPVGIISAGPTAAEKRWVR